MNIWIKRALALILTLTVIISALTGLAFVMNEKGCYGGKLPFYSSKDEYEVLFFGTSHIYNGVYCMEMYRDYGIWSYNLGEPGERMPMTYWAFRDAIAHHKPKLVVVDAYSLESKNQKNDPKSSKRCHYTFDGMPLGMDKIKGVRDTIEKEDWFEFLFPLSIYHGRWAGLTEKDFKIDTFRDNANGCAYINTVAGSVSGPNLIGEGNYTWVDDNATLYLQKVIDECKAANIEVLLLNMPFNASEENQQRTNLAYKLAEKNGIAYLDLLYHTKELGFDYYLDDADGISHINPMGARKVTDFLGKYLRDNYDLTDYRETDRSAEYEKKYEEYCIDGKDTMIKAATDATALLTLLTDRDYESTVTIMDSKVMDNAIIKGILDYGESNGSISVIMEDEAASKASDLQSETDKTDAGSADEDRSIMAEADEALAVENGNDMANAETKDTDAVDSIQEDKASVDAAASEDSIAERADFSVKVTDRVTGGLIEEADFSLTAGKITE